MAIEEIITKKIVTLTLSPESSDNLYAIGEKNPFNKDGYEVLAEYWELLNLQAINYVTSLGQIPYPTFPLEASDSERSLELLNLQWLSPNCHLKIWLAGNSNTAQVDLFSLLSPSPYPYSKISIGDYSLGSDSTLKASIYDSGYGLLAGTDKVIIVGELIHHISLKSSETINNTSIDLSILSTAIDGISQALNAQAVAFNAQAVAMENQALAIGEITLNVNPTPNPNPNPNPTIEEIIMTTNFNTLPTITALGDNDKFLVVQNGVLKLISKADFLITYEANLRVESSAIVGHTTINNVTVDSTVLYNGNPTMLFTASSSITIDNLPVLSDNVDFSLEFALKVVDADSFKWVWTNNTDFNQTYPGLFIINEFLELVTDSFAVDIPANITPNAFNVINLSRIGNEITLKVNGVVTHTGNEVFNFANPTFIIGSSPSDNRGIVGNLAYWRLNVQ